MFFVLMTQALQTIHRSSTTHLSVPMRGLQPINPNEGFSYAQRSISTPAMLSSSPENGSYLSQFQQQQQQQQQSMHYDASASSVPYRIRAYTDIYKRLPLRPLRSHKLKRLSNVEIRRRQIIDAYRSSVLQVGNHSVNSRQHLESFLMTYTEADYYFLGGNLEVEESQENNLTVWKGHVALAMSRRHWSEHFMTVTREFVTLTRSREGRKKHFQIPVSKILCVKPLSHQNSPIQTMGFFEIETFSRVYVFMVKGESIH